MAIQVIQEDDLFTFKEAMDHLRVSRSTLYRLMWSGQLTGHKVGNTWRFYRSDLRACVSSEQAPADQRPSAGAQPGEDMQDQETNPDRASVSPEIRHAELAHAL